MIFSDKNTLRAQIKKSRDILQNKEEKEASILLHMEEFLLKYEDKNHIGLYYPLGSEVSILPIMSKFPHKNYYLPKIQSAQMSFSPFKLGENLLKDEKNIPSPKTHEISDSLDIIFTPLIGFTEQGDRLGQGGGFFDRYIQKSRKEGQHTKFIGIAFECQKQEILPQEPHDEKLDAVITEKRIRIYTSFIQ